VATAVPGPAGRRRFFFANDPVLGVIRRRFGVDYRRSLATIIRANTGVTTQPDVFRVPPAATGRSSGRRGSRSGAGASRLRGHPR
jgi:hypothetical protein